MVLEAISAPPAVSPRSSSSTWVVGGHIGAPYRLLLPSFGAMVVVFRCRRDLFSLSVVGGRFYCLTQRELYSVSAPYRLLLPSFGAVDFIGRCRQELYSVSVAGYFFLDAA